MNNVLKIVKLDTALLKPYSKSYLIVLIAPLVVIYSMQDIISGMVFCMCMMSMTSNYTFAIAEKNDLNRLYGLLPISKKDIVTGKYLFMALSGVVAVAVSTVLNMIVLILLKKQFTTDEVIIGISIGITLYIFFTSIQIPGYFRYGAIKGRFISFIPFLGLFLMGVIAKNLNPASIAKVSSIAILNNSYAMMIFLLLFDIVIYGISIGITQRIYGRMEL